MNIVRSAAFVRLATQELINTAGMSGILLRLLRLRCAR